MPRPLRIGYEGAIYHVLNRGDRRELIFRDDADRKRFLETLGEACAKTDWQVHALCLMGNHFHLVVETPRAEPRSVQEAISYQSVNQEHSGLLAVKSHIEKPRTTTFGRKNV